MSRREYLGYSTVALSIITAGCGSGGGDGGQDRETERQERVCTEAYVTDFNWDSKLFGEDEFSGEIINEGDVAGTVVVELSFYQTEDAEIEEGSLRRSVAIGAQETKEITITANPPTDDSEWATLDVTQQDCQIK